MATKNVIKKFIKNGVEYEVYAAGGANIEVDSALSSTSTNPVQNKVVKAALDGKQDSLTTQTAYANKGSATKVPKITTNNLGQVTKIEEVTIDQPTVPTKTSDLTNDGDGTNAFTTTANVLTKTNTTSYTPTANYHPATKKYIDDLVGDVETLLAAL